MLVLSFLLALAGALMLVIGLFGSGLALLWASIGCSGAAGVALAPSLVRRPVRPSGG